MTTYNNNNRNNSQDRVSVNTRSIQFFMDLDATPAGVVPTTLVNGFWNSFVSIKIHPALPESQRTRNNMFNYDESITSALTIEKALLLHNLIDTEIIPAAKNGEYISRAVTVSGGKTLILVGVEEIAGEPHAKLSIIRVDENTLQPTEALSYYFNSLSVVKDFNPEAVSDFGIDVHPFSELETFSMFLAESAQALTFANVHGARTVDRRFRETLLSAVGVKSGGSGYDNASSSGRSNPFENRRRSAQSDNAPMETKLDNAENIESMMQ